MRRLLAIGTILLFSATGRAAAQSDTAAVLGTLEAMFAGMRTRDTASVRALFEPQARLVGVRIRGDGSQVLQAITVDQWVRIIGTDPRPDWIERAFNPEVRIEGTLAQVWAEYDFHFGKTFSHCGIDAVQLLKLGGRWRIVSIADTYRTTGCPRRPPPSDAGR